MYSFIEMDEDYKVEEISSEEMMSIISLQKDNDSSDFMDESGNVPVTSNSSLSLSQRLSEFANAPMPDWLLKKV